MPADWQMVTIDELKAPFPASIAIGPFGSRMKSDRYVEEGNDGVPVIRGNNISDTKTFKGEFVYVSPETADELRSSNVFSGDLVFPHRGNIGEVAIVPMNHQSRYVLSTSLMKLSCDTSLVDPLFVFYFFRSPSGRHRLLQNASQVGTPGIATPLTSLKSIELALPPLPEQHAIAHILSTLDDKIDLNRQTNQTLEHIAATLFKSWFVAFDPVRAKADGRQPEGMNAETAALFPDRLVESEIGEIPEGWQVAGLDDIARFVNGLALQKYPPDGSESLPVIKIAQLRKGNTDGADRASARLDPEFIVEDGDVLFSWSGTLEVEIWAGGSGALNQHLFRVSSPEFPKWFYFLWTRQHLPWFRDLARDKATTMGHIQRKHLTQAKVLVPDPKLLNQMNHIMSPVFAAMLNNSLQSRTLMSLRDLILPRLLSGEISVWSRDEQTPSGHQEGSQAAPPEESQLSDVGYRVVQSAFRSWSR